MHIPLDTKIREIKDLPYTLSFVIRKRMQIDSLAELPKDKKPPDKILWDGTSDDLEDWLNKVMDIKKKQPEEVFIDLDNIEG